MRINLENKTMDFEPRDWQYIMSVYLRSYRFRNNNQNPEKIVVPMFSEAEGVPIEWVPEISPVVTEIIKDGSNIPVATEEQIQSKDEVEDMMSAAKKSGTTVWKKAEPVPREPKLPANPIPPGQPLDSMHPRDTQDLKRAKLDLKPEPEVKEDEELEVKDLAEKPVKKSK